MLHCSIEPKHQAAKPTGTFYQRDNTKPGGPLTHPPITEVKRRINPQPEQASVHMFYLLAEGSKRETSEQEKEVERLAQRLLWGVGLCVLCLQLSLQEGVD